ncbi:hypothetical protein R1flu_017755 [Riccia fluitans]|uniref:Uncharacterized protein n=1 Tax=Riccia fluitans TaxID=41844 RepID=A0ABD1ZEW6_9MARC
MVDFGPHLNDTKFAPRVTASNLQSFWTRNKVSCTLRKKNRRTTQCENERNVCCCFCVGDKSRGTCKTRVSKGVAWKIALVFVDFSETNRGTSA